MPTHGHKPVRRRLLDREDSDIDQGDAPDPEARNAHIPRDAPPPSPPRTREAAVGHLAGMREPLALSVEEAAATIGVARSTFYAIVLPELRVVRIGRRVVVPRRELERWLERSAAILPRHA